MNADDRDVRIEELLRTTLTSEAEMIMPAGDGLSRIQSRLGTRRGRVLWLRPVFALGALAAIIGAGVGAYQLAQPPTHANGLNLSNSGSPSPSESASSAPSSAPPIAVATFPKTGFYPFTSAAGEQAWEQQGGPKAEPWKLDPNQVAKLFVANFLHQPSVNTQTNSHRTSRSATVVLGRYITDGGAHHLVNVTSVRLAKFGKAWIVVGADDPNRQLSVTSPIAGTQVTSPLVVGGPAYGVDEAVRVSVWSLTGDASPTTSATASFGNGSPPWSASVSFNVPSDPTGAVVVLEPSAADGGPGRITVVGVRFNTAEAVDYPKIFYGVKNGRVTTFLSRTGASLSYLTVAQPGTTTSDPQLVGTDVYYLQGGGVCGNALMSIPATGGQTQTIVTSNAGYTISSFAVSADGTRIATFQSACAVTPAQPQGLLVAQVRGTTQSHTVNFQSFPPMVVGDPTWLPDNTHLIAVVQTGTQADVRSYDAFGSRSWDDSTAACSGFNPSGSGLPRAVHVDNTGALWFTTQTGNSMDVVRCVGGTATTVFSVTGNDTPEDLAVTGNGDAALVTDVNGSVWRWSKAGGLVHLAPSVPLRDVSW